MINKPIFLSFLLTSLVATTLATTQPTLAIEPKTGPAALVMVTSFSRVT